MDKLDKKIIKVLEFLCCVCLIILVGSVTYQIIVREILRTSATWTTEVGRFMFLAVVFLGVPITIIEETQMSVTIVKDMFAKNKKGTLILNIIGDVFCYFTIITLCYTCWDRTVAEWGSKIPTVEWMTYGNQYLVMFIGCLFMLYMQVRRTVRYVGAFKSKETEEVK